MTDTIFTIGGEAIAVPPMNFKALKVALPAVKAISTEASVVDMTEQVISIIAAALKKTRPDLTTEVLEDKLTGFEMEGLMQTLPGLLRASGLIPEAPPDTPRGEAKPSIRAA